jgi:hypothetical protein
MNAGALRYTLLASVRMLFGIDVFQSGADSVKNRQGATMLHFACWSRQPYPSGTVRDMDKPTVQTVRHRLIVARLLYRFHSEHPLPPGSPNFHYSYLTQSPLGT